MVLGFIFENFFNDLWLVLVFNGGWGCKLLVGNVWFIVGLWKEGSLVIIINKRF